MFILDMFNKHDLDVQKIKGMGKIILQNLF